MAKPQQPELRRSGRVPALDPDASEAKLSAERPHRGSDPDGPVPEDQRPGHHPEHEQDKPDLDAFAERLGIVSEQDEPDDAPHVVEDSRVTRLEPKTRSKGAARADADTSPTWSPVGLLLVGPVTDLLVARGVLRALKRFRR
jgi:hypothetical protein